MVNILDLSLQSIRGRGLPAITDRGLARHVGDGNFVAWIRSGGRKSGRVRKVVGGLVEHNPREYYGQQRFAILPQGAKIGSVTANLYPGRTTIAFRSSGGKGLYCFYDYAPSQS